MPLSFLAGNHDLRDVSGTSNSAIRKRFASYAKQELLQSVLIEEQFINYGEASYYLFTAGGTDFILLNMSMYHSHAARKWAKEVLDKYKERVAIIATHSALEDDGSFSGDGNRLIWDVISLCPNVRLVLCGHNDGAVLRKDGYDDDGDGIFERSVATMMFNLQDDRELGTGFLRMLEFNPATRSIRVYSYNPCTNSCHYAKADGQAQNFVLLNAY